MGYRYILRYYLDPGFEEDARVRELVGFCTASRIPEVMLFYNAEELFQGYPPPAEVDRWFALAGRTKAALAAAGIDLSLNPWTTTGHLARGRTLGEAQSGFQTMVGETGAASGIVACPLDRNWQRQLADLFARMAAELDPTTIWIEDDWRLHNHDPEMGHGGCFCPLHLRRFEERTGIRTDRKTLLRNVTAPGDPHPWRRPWLQVCAESLREPAEYLRHRIHAANPRTRLGLMSSLPDVHAAEGRDWGLLKTAFSPERPLRLRPHLPPYTETQPLQAYPAPTRQTAAELPPQDAEIYPELENSPRCGPYSKSRAFSAWQIAASIPYGSRGITINHYDMMGNGIALDPAFGRMLADLKPRLDAAAGLGACEENAVGVDVLFSPAVAEHVRSRRPGSMSGLVNESCLWSSVLGILGISHRLTRRFDPRRPTAVGGDTLRTAPDEDLRAMLKGTLLLDAASVEIVCERGLGGLIGLEGCAPGGDDGHAYESIEDDDAAYYGVPRPRMSAQRDGHYLAMRPSSGAEVLSVIRRYDRSPLYPGMLRHRNRLGGTVLACAHYLGRGQFFMGFFNVFRRRFLQRLVEATGTAVALGRNDPLNVYCNRLADGWLVTAVNPSLDPLDRVALDCLGMEAASAEILDDSGDWRPVSLRRLPGLPPLGAMYLRLARSPRP